MKRRQLLNQQSTGRWLALFIVAFMMPLALWAQQDYGITVGGVQVTSENAGNAIADDAFVAFPFLKYNDLSNTAITGLKVSRSEGPFKGVSKNTFIYLPAGNSSDEPNVVIGNPT